MIRLINFFTLKSVKLSLISRECLPPLKSARGSKIMVDGPKIGNKHEDEMKQITIQQLHIRLKWMMSDVIY